MQEDRPTLVLRGSQRRSDLPKCLRISAGGEMVGVVLRIFFLMQGCDRIRNKVHIHNIDLVSRSKRQDGQLGQKYKGPYQVELGSLRMPAIAEYNTRSQNR